MAHGRHDGSVPIRILNLRRCVLPVVAVVLMAGLATAGAESVTASQSSLNDGYSLFYDFCSQESQLSLLLWVKKMPADISDYAKKISATAKGNMAILTAMGVGDAALRLDKVSLPGFELSVRESMAVDRKQQLLWGSSGAAFVQAMTMTQSETTNYGLHVVKVLSETEPDRDRARALRHMYDQWLALHVEAYRLVR